MAMPGHPGQVHMKEKELRGLTWESRSHWGFSGINERMKVNKLTQHFSGIGMYCFCEGNIGFLQNNRPPVNPSVVIIDPAAAALARTLARSSRTSLHVSNQDRHDCWLLLH